MICKAGSGSNQRCDPDALMVGARELTLSRSSTARCVLHTVQAVLPSAELEVAQDDNIANSGDLEQSGLRRLEDAAATSRCPLISVVVASSRPNLANCNRGGCQRSHNTTLADSRPSGDRQGRLTWLARAVTLLKLAKGMQMPKGWFSSPNGNQKAGLAVELESRKRKNAGTCFFFQSFFFSTN